MRQQTAVVIKVYNSASERESNVEPMATKTVYDVTEFDAFIEEHSFPAKYFAFEGEGGVKLKTREAARYILQNA
jgi:hypothetical protein